ncbi:MAG: single-stranded-DNA-specific exonuclease RecJ [Lentisphaerae bacterium]|nr:single-stranded-DNA-specific exonuclease RecJ [Lentisphaerota bacterium]
MSSLLSEWITPDADNRKAKNIADKLSLPLPIAQVLVGRGIDNASDADAFLTPRLSSLPDPFILPDMAAAVDRIWKAIDRNERIVVHGDYDADGVTATALMTLVLRSLGGNIETFIPNRMTDGYGFTTKTLAQCITDYSPSLIITVDCGTAAIDWPSDPLADDLDVIITDHHEPSGKPAKALAIVNPKVGGDHSAAQLAGVGVAFKLCHAIVKQGMANNRPEVSNIDLRNMLDLVAVGTIADVVSLRNENRVLVKHGMYRLDSSQRPGFKALREIAKVPNTPITARQISFLIAPRINAVGRMGHADSALELLLTSNIDRAFELAAVLDSANIERRRTEDIICEEALSQVDLLPTDKRSGIVVGGDGWHIGTIGIVASRICETYFCPAVVVAFDNSGVGRGSCRSIENINMLDMLGACSELLVEFGGHKMAAGLTIRREKYEEFQAKFNAVCSLAFPSQYRRKPITIDAWLSRLGDADEILFDAIEKLRPFGAENESPVFAVKNVKVIGCPRLVGANRQHLKLSVGSGGTMMDAIAFDMGNRNLPPVELDIAFHLERNTYMGRANLQLNVVDFRASSPLHDSSIKSSE